MSPTPPWLTFRRYAAATTSMTLVLVGLGIYTAATGSGLACEAQWPLCSDQLIPALTINPDFLEWFHRVWAMVTGFLMLGLAGWAWLGGRSRNVRLAATLAVVVLPLQITVGAITVTIGGMVPGGYSAPTHAAHLVVALVIFTLLSLTTLFAWLDARGKRRVDAGARTLLRRSFAAAAGLLLVAATMNRAVPLVTYSPGAQAWFYAVALAAHFALLAAILIASATARSTAATVGGVAIGALFATMLLGRDLVLYTATWETVTRVTLAVAILAAVGGFWLVSRGDSEDVATSSVLGD